MFKRKFFRSRPHTAIVIFLVTGCTTQVAIENDASALLEDGSTPQDSSAPATSSPVYSGINPIVTSQAELAKSLFPLAVGLKWTYDYDPGIAMCTRGLRTIEVRSMEPNGAYTVDTPCDYYGPGAERLRVDGEEVFSQVATSAVSRKLAPPLTDGAEFMMNSSVRGQWLREREPVTVAAGTFHDCWTVVVRAFGGVGTTTYCRGVGAVRAMSTVGGHSMELTSYDFSSLQ